MVQDYLVSVIVCTTKENIGSCVESLLKQGYQNFEIIVVCTHAPRYNKDMDNTAPIRIEVAPKAGLSEARNLGIRLSKGDVISFIDDDAVADPCWLEALLNHIGEGFHIVGGPILPCYLAPQPSWWDERRFGHMVSVNTYTREIYGCNIAFTRDVVDALGGFSPKLGRHPRKMLSNEEREFVARAAVAGFKIGFFDDIRVKHLIDTNRLRFPYLIKRCWYQGASDAILIKLGRTSLLKPSLRAFLKLCIHIIKLILTWIVPTICIGSIFIVSAKLGFLCNLRVKI